MAPADRSPRALLIYPPLFDPTAGYHSLGHLDAYAAARGSRDVQVVDANVEAVAMVPEPAEVDRYLSQLASRRAALADRRERLGPAESVEYGEPRKLDLVSPESIEAVVRVLRTTDHFYDYPSYRAAVERIISWPTLLATLGVPGQFRNGFTLQPIEWSPSSSADLCDEALMTTVARPFARDFAERLIPRLVASRPDLVGINLAYFSQTPFALHLRHELRQRLPGCHLTAGGTKLADIWKYLAERAWFFAIFDNVDPCVLGEGESAFWRLLEHLAGQQRADQLGLGTVLPPRHTLLTAPPAYGYEVTKQLPPPDLADLPYEKYLSGVDVRWGAEIRLERYWTPQRCRALYASESQAVSVGFESASQRVLDLIAKDTRVADVPAIIEAMTAAGIGVQMIGFTGFPSEAFGESVRFLTRHRRQRTLGNLGEFVLTPDSILAREPDRFSVANLRTRRGRDIRRALRYDPPSQLSEARDRDLAAAKRRLRIADFDRPWLGGVDTPHTYFYHDRYGAYMVTQLRDAVAARAAGWREDWRLNGIVVDDATVATDRWGRLRIGPAGEMAGTTCLVRAHGVPFRLTAAQAAAIRRWRAGGPAPDGNCRDRWAPAHLLVPSAAPVVA